MSDTTNDEQKSEKYLTAQRKAGLAPGLVDDVVNCTKVFAESQGLPQEKVEAAEANAIGTLVSGCAIRFKFGA